MARRLRGGSAALVAWCAAAVVLAVARVAGAPEEAAPGEAAEAPLSLQEMLQELDAVAEILDQEFSERRRLALVRDEECEKSGAGLALKYQGVAHQMNATRQAVTGLAAGARRAADELKREREDVAALTTRVKILAEEIHGTREDLMDAERLKAAHRSVRASHAERNGANTALLRELDAYIQGRPGGGGGGGGGGDAAPTAMVELAAAPTADAGAGIAQEIRQLISEMEAAPGAHDSDEEDLRAADLKLVNHLNEKLNTLEAELGSLDTEKKSRAASMKRLLAEVKSLNARGDLRNSKLSELRASLAGFASRLALHKQECKKLEAHFEAFKVEMLGNLKLVKKVKTALGARRTEGIRVVAEALPDALDAPEIPQA